MVRVGSFKSRPSGMFPDPLPRHPHRGLGQQVSVSLAVGIHGGERGVSFRADPFLRGSRMARHVDDEDQTRGPGRCRAGDAQAGRRLAWSVTRIHRVPRIARERSAESRVNLFLDVIDWHRGGFGTFEWSGATAEVQASLMCPRLLHDLPQTGPVE